MIIAETLPSSINTFCLVGINYRKSDVGMRGLFSFSPEQASLVLQEAAGRKFPGCLVLSTCNRTEIYGICPDPEVLAEMLCRHTHGDPEDFRSQGYQLGGGAAIRHLCKVAAGLDSQIIGDYEILSQLRKAARQARENNCLNGFMERVIDYALRASKEIKTRTKLSSGTISVAYAAIEIIKDRCGQINQKRILLTGAGKFGNHMGKNLRDYLPGSSLFFANRTDEKAFELAEECGARFVPYSNLAQEANAADIIIVSSAAEDYTILPSFFTTRKPRLILDLSVPRNVSPELQDLDGISLMNVDEISMRLNKVLSIRQAEIPKALAIIEHTISELTDWHKRQLNNPVLRKMKSLLYDIGQSETAGEVDEGRIHKVVSSLAVQLRKETNKGCQCISALNGYLQMN